MKHIITFILTLVVVTATAQKAEKWPKSHFTERCEHGRPKIGEDTTRLDIEDVMALLAEQRTCCCLDVFKYVELFPYQSGMVAYTADSLIVSNANGNGELIDSTISRLAQYERSWVNIHIDGNPDRHVIMLVHPNSMSIVGPEYHFGIDIIRQQGPAFIEGEFVCLVADHAGAVTRPPNFQPYNAINQEAPIQGTFEIDPIGERRKLQVGSDIHYIYHTNGNTGFESTDGITTSNIDNGIAGGNIFSQNDTVGDVAMGASANYLPVSYIHSADTLGNMSDIIVRPDSIDIRVITFTLDTTEIILKNGVALLRTATGTSPIITEAWALPWEDNSAPSTLPDHKGRFYIDTSSSPVDVYFSVGTASLTDWIILN